MEWVGMTMEWTLLLFISKKQLQILPSWTILLRAIGKDLWIQLPKVPLPCIDSEGCYTYESMKFFLFKLKWIHWTHAVCMFFIFLFYFEWVSIYFRNTFVYLITTFGIQISENGRINLPSHRVFGISEKIF